jgi:hypothetical protein
MVIEESGTMPIDKSKSDINIDVYPNPASEYLILNNYAPEKVLTVELYNMSGKAVRTLTSSGTQTILNISDLSQGIYFLKLKWNKSSSFKKIIKY